MSKEAMKQALEAQEHMKLSRDYARLPGYPLSNADRQMEKSTAALREALAKQPAQQEPVAYLHTKLEGVAVPHRPADLDKHPDRWEALYKTPPPCPTCEALARTVMLDQKSHDAQRTWVGLTDEELFGLTDEMYSFARHIEAKLREKNT